MKRPIPEEFASAFIDEKSRNLVTGAGRRSRKVREIIHEADPEVLEEWSGWEAQCGLTTESSRSATTIEIR